MAGLRRSVQFVRVDRAAVGGHATIGIMTATFLLVLVVVLVVGGLVYGVVSLLSGDDPGLVPAEPDGRARPLPNDRSLREEDLKEIRFDIALRGYRMSQVDRMLRRVAYDLGYKDEMIAVLEAEVAALREGRLEDAELLRKAREAASTPERDAATGPESPSDPVIDLGVVGSDASDPSSEGRTSGDDHDRTVGAESERAAAADPGRTVAGPERTAAEAYGGKTAKEPPEGSLRRPEPVASTASVAADGPASADVAADDPVSADASAGGDGPEFADSPAAPVVDGADRPAHA